MKTKFFFLVVVILIPYQQNTSQIWCAKKCSTRCLVSNKKIDSSTINNRVEDLNSGPQHENTSAPITPIINDFITTKILYKQIFFLAFDDKLPPDASLKDQSL